jgi:hypothetical protein
VCTDLGCEQSARVGAQPDGDCVPELVRRRTLEAQRTRSGAFFAGIARSQTDDGQLTRKG